MIKSASLAHAFILIDQVVDSPKGRAYAIFLTEDNITIELYLVNLGQYR